MFYAIDKITNEIILSINIRTHNYKNSYNKTLRYRCAGCLNNGDKCNDNNVSFVNSKKKEPHFRHSKNAICSATEDFTKFNKDFYINWFKLFKKEYRKPYWFNVNLEEIKNETNIIMIRYCHQTEKSIKNIELNVNKNKIIWILSLETRKYNKILFNKGKIYIDFIGNKNDIPVYDSNKSIVYLDTGYDILLKVKLESYNSNGQEIEFVYIKDFFKLYDNLFIAYSYRKKYTIIEKILNDINNYNNLINILITEYNETELKLKTSENLKENLENMYKIYNKLIDLNYNDIVFSYNKLYTFCINKMYNIEKEIDYYNINIYNIEKDFEFKKDNNNSLFINYETKIDIFKKNINYIKHLFNILFKNIENKEWFFIKKKNKEYNNILETEEKFNNNKNYYIYLCSNILEYYNNIHIINEYDNMCYNYLNDLFYKKQNYEKQKLIKINNIKLEIKKLNIEEKYNYYCKKHQITDIELLNDKFINILLNDIKNNYEKIKNIKDEYLRKYYIYITHHLNYDIPKMIKYIIYQQKYLK